MMIVEHQELGLSYIYRRVNQLAQNQEWQAVVGKFSNQVIILMQASKQTNEYIQQLNQLFVDDISQGSYRIAVSTTAQNASSVQRSYQQCQETLEIAHRLHNTNSVIYFADLGYLHTLYHAGKDALQDNPLLPCLLELQQEVQADLFHTLDAYLDTGGNGVQTAEVLHIHRSTLNYRLSRISQICAVDLSNPHTRLNLQIAIKLILLFVSNSSASGNS
jgi:DNA-binding PucR family transcriptional regulator